MEKAGWLRALRNSLNYVPFATALDASEPVITIVYSLKDGSEIKLSANHTGVDWNGKRRQ